MIQTKCFQVNPLQDNCYVVSDDSQEAVIIDCGALFSTERQNIINYITNNHLKPVHLLCTHGHFDHAFGNDLIYETYGLKPEVHPDDVDLITDLAQQCVEMNINIGYNRQSPPVGTLLKDGDIITFGQHQLQVIATPGHTPGSICFYCEQESTIFTGDTLFRMSVGRTDLPGGSQSQLMESLSKKIATLPRDTIVYPGHGPGTYMAEELRMNPYIK